MHRRPEAISPVAFGRRVIRAYIADDMALYAAALSFHALLALFPFLIFLLALLSFLRIPDFFDWVLEQASIALPSPAFSVVRDVVSSVQDQEQGGLLSVSAIIALGVASTGVRALMNALNSAYSIPEARALWKKYLLSIGYTLGLAGLIIIAGGALLLGPDVIEWLSGFVGLSEVFVAAWTWLRFPVIVAGLMLICALTYYSVPNIDQPFLMIMPGAIVAVLMWVVASIGFSIYVTNFASYSTTYGSPAGIVVLLFYFFLSAAVLLLGAEINAELHALRRGPARPKEVSEGAAER